MATGGGSGTPAAPASSSTLVDVAGASGGSRTNAALGFAYIASLFGGREAASGEEQGSSASSSGKPPTGVHSNHREQLYILFSSPVFLRAKGRACRLLHSFFLLARPTLQAVPANTKSVYAPTLLLLLLHCLPFSSSAVQPFSATMPPLCTSKTCFKTW